jgi:hypothetical protein
MSDESPGLADAARLLQFELNFLRCSRDHLVERLLGGEPPTGMAFHPDDLCLSRCLATPVAG